jgi:hypothetical protein
MSSNSSKLRLSRVDEQDGRWDQVVRSSKQGTLFSERLYLSATGRKHHLYWVLQGTGTEIKAGVALIVSEDERRCELDDLVIYGGILFNLDPNRPLVKRRHDEFQITEFVIDELVKRYESVEVQLSPDFCDLRPFLWHRYHDADEHKFSLDLRYTSLIDISSLRGPVGVEERSACFNEMETVRRYSVREARKKGGTISRPGDGELLVSFYEKLMIRQGESQSTTMLTGLRRVLEALLGASRGAVYHVHNSDQAVIYAVFYAWDDRRAYYLFGAGHPELREPWQGTLAHWEAFKDLAQRVGVEEVDMEGVNSPQRGWFKLGFGGNLKPYYKVSKSQSG